jgi:hypothetical protein
VKAQTAPSGDAYMRDGNRTIEQRFDQHRFVRWVSPTVALR